MALISCLRVEHIPLILDLWNEAGLPTRPLGRDRPELIAAEMKRDPELWKGAWDGEKLVGVILATDDGRKGWLNRLALHPDYRGKGLGRLLVEEAEKVLRDRGREVLATMIDDDNPNSMKFFSHMGYKREEHIIYFTKRDRPES